MTIANLKKPDLPEEVEELSHEEAVALKDLDPVLQEATMDTLVDELAAEYQTWARSLFILDVEHVMLVSVEIRFHEYNFCFCEWYLKIEQIVTKSAF